MRRLYFPVRQYASRHAGHRLAGRLARLNLLGDLARRQLPKLSHTISSALPPAARPPRFITTINCGYSSLEQAAVIHGNFEIQPSGGVGAFVDGIDLATDLSDNVTGALRSALGKHGVLFFPRSKN